MSTITIPVRPVTLASGGGDSIRFTQALWYAWGAADHGVKLPGDAFAFARDYATVYRMFAGDRMIAMASIQRAFANWLAGQPIDSF